MGTLVGSHDMWNGTHPHPQDGQPHPRPDMSGSGSNSGEATMTGDRLSSGIDNTSHSGMTTYHGPDIEVNAPAKGMHVEESLGSNDYMDNATGERIDLTEKLRRSSSGASTSPGEYVSGSGAGRSMSGLKSKGERFSAVKPQSLVPDAGGEGVSIGNSTMGTPMQNVVSSGQNAVAKEGTYAQMGAVGDAAHKSGAPISPSLKKGIAEGEEFKKTSSSIGH